MKPKPLVRTYVPFRRPEEIEAIRTDGRAAQLFDEELLQDDDEPISRRQPCPETWLATVKDTGPGWDEDDNGADDEPAGDEADQYQYDSNGAFIIESGTEWQLQHDEEPEAGMLFGNLWKEDELCILFADTNTGKSILAVQIADSISRGAAIPGFSLQAPAAPVLYFDFELSAQQFRSRYSSPAHGKYPFNGSFYRALMNPNSTKRNKFGSYAGFINNEIENALLCCKAKVLIIDNITCLPYGTHSAAGALRLMEYLQSIKRRYQVAILVLAHTPKRNPTRPITRNDLQGSKMLLNLADSAFAIGESQRTPGLRYLKQIKQRSGAEAYGAANVCLGSIVKTGPFLHFAFNGHAYESDHLAPQNQQYRRAIENRILQLSRQGRSIRGIAAELGLPGTTVFRLLKKCTDAEKYTYSAGAGVRTNEATAPDEKEAPCLGTGASPAIKVNDIHPCNYFRYPEEQAVK